MGWARIDDGFHDHPKLMGLSLEAVGLWTLSLTWARRHHGASFGLLGHIPADLPGRLAGTKGKKLAAELEAHRLWDAETGVGGWVIHDYVDYLAASDKPATADDVRRARSEAGKRGAEARWGKSKLVAEDTQTDSKLPSESDSKPMPPSRPVPTQPSPPSVVEPPHKRGHRLPEDWAPTSADIDWARTHRITDDAARRSTERFRNHWLDATGRTATKLDWSRAWRNWLDTDAERAARRQPAITSRDQQATDDLFAGAARRMIGDTA